jgi:hypothetical protein
VQEKHGVSSVVGSLLMASFSALLNSQSESQGIVHPLRDLCLHSFTSFLLGHRDHEAVTATMGTVSDELHAVICAYLLKNSFERLWPSFLS